MRGYNLNCSPPPFLLLIFLVVICFSVRALGDDSCTNVFCGEGSCEPSNNITGYNCLCNRGWKKDLGLISLPSCVFPNCTMDLNCGNSGPPPPPPPPPSIIPGPCFLVWCGDGTCLVNGTQHVCECNAGFANLIGLPELPCFKQCSLGIDCTGVWLGASATPPPPPNGTLAPPRSPPNGSADKISKRWSFMVLLSTCILAWIMYECKY